MVYWSKLKSTEEMTRLPGGGRTQMFCGVYWRYSIFIATCNSERVFLLGTNNTITMSLHCFESISDTFKHLKTLDELFHSLIDWTLQILQKCLEQWKIKIWNQYLSPLGEFYLNNNPETLIHNHIMRAKLKLKLNRKREWKKLLSCTWLCRNCSIERTNTISLLPIRSNQWNKCW